MNVAEKSYDYIIAGGGMAGLSLGFYLNRSYLRDKKILIIDRDEKNINDHTWCFWENEESVFEEIVYRSWNKFWFHGTDDFSKLLELEHYQYKMIRAIDFYKFVIPKLKENPNIEFLKADISKVENDLMQTNKGDYSANKFIFDSFTRKKYDNPKYYNLWQHFLGWVIETKEDVFNANEPTLFDFRIEQKDECRFVYVMPFSANKALIEFTIFSDNLIERKEYESNLKDYLAYVLKIENYEIKEKEFGVIPMSDESHKVFVDSKTVRIGTSGGYVKASTGYSFKRTQRRLQVLVDTLEKKKWEEFEVPQKTSNWKSYLDSVLLNILQTKKHSADSVFTSLFKNNSATQVLKFLDEDTSFREDLRIMQSVPILPFTKAAAEVFGRKLK